MKTTTVKAKRKTYTSRIIKENSFPVVAIGASAGGLEAMMELLRNLPSDTGMAFIYVQHLSPDHKSMLTEILSKTTDMKVQEIDDMDKIKPDNVFVIPYNKGIAVTDGHIHLIPRSESIAASSIDILFTSLARAQKNRVIGIILSGSASDGTIGIREIKAEGGLTFAQDDSAKFTSMPHSAIAAGAIDYILSPKDIALELARLSRHPFMNAKNVKAGQGDMIDNADPDLKEILNYVYRAKGVDFTQYKMNTIKRRIIRRMMLYRIKSLREYADLLKDKKEEIDILYQDLLINVTSFFRDTDTHKYLKESLLPRILKAKKDDEIFRIWVPACATGEEPYSIAMMLLEIQSSLKIKFPVQIFATDLSDQAIVKARSGNYELRELESVSPRRIQRFFTQSDQGYRVNKDVRDMCVFAVHNVLTDPPFSRLDFISCCNLFIYLDLAAQKKVINTFHYALGENGFLMLGKSENIAHSENLFLGYNKKYKIFQSRKNTGKQTLPVLTPRFVSSMQINTSPGANVSNRSQRNTYIDSNGLGNTIDQLLIADFMPASVVINHQMEILQFRGKTESFLTFPKGKASFSLLKMARQGIAFELRNTITKAIKTKHKTRKSGIEMKYENSIRIISIEVIPLDLKWDEPLLLVMFSLHDQVDSVNLNSTDKKFNNTAKDRRIQKLEEELAASQADAISFLEEQEAFAEDLQRANEEVVSSNEELQTVNEEQETASEEIESANEELIAANQELQTRIDMLHEAYEYSEAIMSTMNEPFIVLDKELRVKSANKIFYEKFSLTKDQTEGTFFYELGNKQWNNPELRKLLDDILPNNSKFDNYEVSHTFINIGEKIMSLNASRVIQKTHREQLILLVIADITEVRHLTMEKNRLEKEIFNKEIVIRNAEKIKLKEAVENRTQELKEANQELEIKNVELQNMNKELESFTYVSGHDLQEPLRKIQTFADRILEKENDNLSDNGKNYFRIMKNAAERMQTLLHDLLAFSRISMAQRIFETSDLRGIIEEVMSDFKDEITEKHAVIEVLNTCEVKIIPFQFRQLIHNLIGNALKFSKPGIPPHITIESYLVNSSKVAGLTLSKDYCCVKISDNGIGFDKEFNEKIFEVFQRLHAKEDYAGTGIGLAIVKKIVENHNGLIIAKSEIDQGATFEIYIPA